MARIKNNSGDALICHSTKKLLESFNFTIKYVKRDGFLELNERELREINSCDYFFIAGGPCVSDQIYPLIYPLVKNLDNIKSKIILYGVGLEIIIKNYNQSFQNKLLSRAEIFTRDEITKKYLVSHNFDCKVSGCSVLFNGGNVVKKFKEVKNGKILFSVSREYSELENKILNILLKKFTSDRLIVCFNHGLTENYDSFSNLLKSKNIQIVDNGKNVDSMIKYASMVDFHVGTRVHNHLLSLSLGIKSLLITIDQRGVGQIESYGSGFDIKNTELHKLEKNIDNALNSDFKIVVDKITNQFTSTRTYLLDI